MTSQLCERIASTEYEISACPRSRRRGGWYSTASPSRLPAPRKKRSTSWRRITRSRAAPPGDRDRQRFSPQYGIGGGAQRRRHACARLRADVEPGQPCAVDHARRRAGAGGGARRDGREILTALVKGVEMQGCIRQASGQFEANTCDFIRPAPPVRWRGGRGRTFAQSRSRSTRASPSASPLRAPVACWPMPAP